MENREFYITGTGVNIKAFEGATDDTSVLMTTIGGWDEDENLEIATTPKLFGNGSYIVSTKMRERTLKISVFFGEETAEPHVADAWLRFNVMSPLRKAAREFTPLLFQRVWKDSAGEAAFTESITGLISKVLPPEVFGDGSIRLNFEVLCKDPDITTITA
jgi:hypothetical protein